MSESVNRAHSRASLLCPLFILLTACVVVHAPTHTRIALFAPFEGRYRDIGYNALYAARLAFADAHASTIDLLAVDSGGTEAVSHAKALAQDPLVMAAIVLGYDGTSPDALRAFGDIPVLVVGDWGAKPASNTVFIFSYQQIAQQITSPSRISVTDAAQIVAPVIGSDVFALEDFAKLRSSLDGVTVLSSGTLPDANFAQRYKGSDQFAPMPSLLATLTDTATSMAISASAPGSRAGAESFLAPDFPNGYWKDAQIHRYHYVNGSLTADNVVK